MNFKRIIAKMGYTAYLTGIITLFVFQFELGFFYGFISELFAKSVYSIFLVPLTLVVTYYIVNFILALIAIKLEDKKINTEFMSDKFVVDDIIGKIILTIFAILLLMNYSITFHEFFKSNKLIATAIMAAGCLIAFVTYTLRHKIAEGLRQINDNSQKCFNASLEVNFSAVTLAIGSLIGLIYLFTVVLKKYGLEGSHYELFVLSFCVVPIIVYFKSVNAMVKVQDKAWFRSIIKSIITFIVVIVMILIGILIYLFIKGFIINGITLDNAKFIIFVFFLIIGEILILTILKRYLRDEL